MLLCTGAAKIPFNYFTKKSKDLQEPFNHCSNSLFALFEREIVRDRAQRRLSQNF
jgi:hypothetical protein